MRKMKTLATAILLASGSSLAMAQSYQAEVGAGYTVWDGADNMFSLYGEYHFAPVNVGATNPLAEAAFLNRSSNVFARGDDDLDFLQAGVEFFVPNTMFYVRGAVTSDRRFDDTDNGWFAQLGVMPIDGLLLTTTVDDDDYDLNVQVKYVTNLGGGNFLNLEAEVVDTDDDTLLTLGADFYFDRTLSVGVQYADRGFDEFTIRARKFFNNELSAAISYTDSDVIDRFTVDVAFRF
jgi:hypothetical protein